VSDLYNFQLTLDEVRHILHSLGREAPAEPVLGFGDWLPRKSRMEALGRQDAALRKNLSTQVEPFMEKLKDGEFEVGDLVSVKMLPLKGKMFEVRSRNWAADLKQYEYVIGSTSGLGKTMVLRSVWLEKL
jgi:hypothetical protein